MTTRIKILPKVLRFGRKLVAIKVDPLWAQYTNSDKQRLYDTGPIIEAWPVPDKHAYEFVKLPTNETELSDMLLTIKSLLVRRFKKQNKPKSFFVDFFAVKDLTDEEKETIDLTEGNIETILGMKEVVEVDPIPIAPIELLNDKTPKGILVKVLSGLGADVSMKQTKEDLLEIADQLKGKDPVAASAE